MKVLNRVLSLLLLLALAAAALLTAGLASGVVTVSRVRQAWPYAPIEAIAHDLSKLGPDRTPPVVVVALVIAVITLALAVRELMPPPRRARTLLLPKGGQGMTEVAFGSLDELAEHSAESLPGIERVRARVNMAHRALRVRCKALVSPYADLATTGPALEQRVKEQLEHLTGVPVREVRVRATVQDERASRKVR